MRRRTLINAAAAVATLACGAPSFAQGYPSKPIMFVVPAPPGGGLDALARTMADEMGKRMGATIVVDNKPGATGMLGTQTVARAQPDGYTVLFTISAPILNAPFMYSKVPYDVRRDLAFITQVCTGPLVLGVGRDVPVKNMKEFLAWAQANKGKLSIGSFGVGTGPHLAGAYLSQSRGLDLTNVAYKGEAPMIQDLVGGQIPVAIGSAGTFMPHLESGRARALAIVGTRRLPELPQVPTLAEAGLTDAELNLPGWVVMMAPAATPAPILSQLEGAARDSVHSTAMKARFQAYGMDGMGTSAEQFRKDYEAALPVVERMVKLSGAKVE
ncbi:Bug family tripartite tricarboxylate transporter substrate binding protein [Variovorax soli]|uniref:Bug family tripartite tricarboxylate transporter substrate binding protein n=1 Tax=Variovorax soli TaxID=376815 RepID=UPI0008387378|nr:tripartite tricarboxylate transporter substrate binding protein [Variovorax soli]